MSKMKRSPSFELQRLPKGDVGDCLIQEAVSRCDEEHLQRTQYIDQDAAGPCDDEIFPSTCSRIFHLPCTVSDCDKCRNVVDEELATVHISSVKNDLLSEPSDRVQHCITDVTQETVILKTEDQSTRSKVACLSTQNEPSQETGT